MRNIVEAFFKDYQPNSSWDVDRTARTKLLLPQILERVDGDILEIGAHCGTTTQVFCEAAEKLGRKVHVVDPWDGRQEGSGEVYNVFAANTGRFSNLTVHKMGSEKPEVLEAIKDCRFAFILIDGLHSYDAVVNDFTKYRHLLVPNGVICVDDWTGPYDFSSEIRRAIHSHLGEFTILASPDALIEKYLTRP